MTSSNDAGQTPAPPDLPDALKTRLEACKSLPSLPAAVARVLTVARQPDASLHEYARAIEIDPALTLRLISLANSVFYARQRHETDTCREAINLIGLDATLAAVMSFGLARAAVHEAMDLDALWQRAIIAALVAHQLAETLCPSRSGTLFTIGLLQDIGRLAIAALENESDSASHQVRDNHEACSRNEFERYGCDHALVGAWLANHWGIPSHLVQGIASSHGPLTGTSTQILCIRLSGVIADAWLSNDSAKALGRLLRRLTTSPMDDISFTEILEKLQSRLPGMAALLEITRPPQRDVPSLLNEAKQHLFRQVLALNARLDDQQAQLDALQTSHDELEQRSRRDALTGLANRAWLEDQLHERFRLCREQHRSLAVIFIDLDCFKQLNDQYGHSVGDQVLRAFAATLSATVREGDLAGRYGGEEFVLILPDEGSEGAMTLAERLSRKLVSDPMATVDGRLLHVSVSIGIACLQDGNYRNAHDLIDTADHRMYRAKHEGRGKTVPLMPSGHA